MCFCSAEHPTFPTTSLIPTTNPGSVYATEPATQLGLKHMEELVQQAQALLQRDRHDPTKVGCGLWAVGCGLAGGGAHSVDRCSSHTVHGVLFNCCNASGLSASSATTPRNPRAPVPKGGWGGDGP